MRQRFAVDVTSLCSKCDNALRLMRHDTAVNAIRDRCRYDFSLKKNNFK